MGCTSLNQISLGEGNKMNSTSGALVFRPENTTLGSSLRGRYWFPASSQKQEGVLTVKPEAQWQKGVFEVIDPGPKRTAPPIVKPDWPKKK